MISDNQIDEVPQGAEVPAVEEPIVPVHFGVFDAQGKLIRKGTVPSNHFADVVANQDPQGLGEYVKEGEFEFPSHPPPANSWAKARAEAYPPMEEFADAMYWAARGDDSKLAAYHAKIDAVKLAIPKVTPVDSSYVYHKP